MTTKRELEEQQFEEELRKASDNFNNLNNTNSNNDGPILCQKSPLRSLDINQSPLKTLNSQLEQSPLLSPRKSPRISSRKGSPQKKPLLSTNSTFDGKSDTSKGSTCGENLDIDSEEDIETEEDEDVDNDREDDNEEDDSFCRNCLRLMSHMRKSAVRWLYMEWYKKAVLGQHLPTISELTPTLAGVLKEATEGQHVRNTLSSPSRSISDIINSHQQIICQQCNSDLDSIIGKTLKPMTALSEMYSSMPSNLANQGKSVSQQQLAYPSSTTNKEHTNDKENVPTAASFFLRAAQKLNLGASSKQKSKKSKSKRGDQSSSELQEQGQVDTNNMVATRNVFTMNVSELIMRTPPHAPPSLFKHGITRRGDCHGKVRVVLRTVNRRRTADSCLTVDAKKKQVLLRESSVTTTTTTAASDGIPPLSSKRFEKAARLYAFDNIFTQESTQQELCSGTLVDLLHTVVNGNDACLLSYGYPKLGKSSIMVGKDNNVENIGIIPCAISWLYQLIDDRKQRTGARFSVRVSAVEVVGKSENLKDLLGEQGNGSMCSSGGASPSLYLPRERASSIQLSDFTELRAPTPEKAAFYFDAAVSSRTTSIPVVNEHGEVIEDPDERRNSNMIFTLHVYQYMIDKVGTGEIHGGRSRFHLIDLSGCSRKKRSRDSGQGAWLPLSALGNVLVSVANGTKHIPHRDSKLTTLLREAMGSLSARVTMIANVSQEPRHCFETLATFQVTSRIHRSRKRKSRYSSTSESESSCDEKKKHRRRCKPVTPMLRTNTCQSDTNNHNESEFTSTSAAEESCDTVIYLGPGGRCLSERDLTDFEHPPPPQQTAAPVVSTTRSTSSSSKPKPILRVPPIIVHQPNHNKMQQQEKSTHNDTSNFSSNNTTKNVDQKNHQQNNSNNNKKRISSPKQLSAETIPSMKRDDNEAPIVVNISSSSMMNVKSSLEERAETTSSPFKQQQHHHVDSNKQQHPNQYCFGQKTKDDFWVGHRRLNLPENLSSQNYSDSLPVRGKNRCYSVPTEPRDANNNNRSTPSSCINKKQRRKTESDANNSTVERLCKSTNSSPCKRGRSTILTTFEDSFSPLHHHHTRAMSLDRTLDHQEQQQHEDVEDITFREDNFRGSNETISSIATVENFERHLVSKIAERFAVEAEFSLGGDDHKIIQTHNNIDNVGDHGEDFYIDDEIETVSAGLDSGNPIDEYTNDYYNDNYLNINNNNSNNNNNNIAISSGGSLIDKVAVRDNDVILCNTCIGECTCYSDDSTSPFFNLKRRGCDSAEDTDERTDKDLRFSSSRSRHSFSSCDSHLNSPRGFDKHPPSEGVSSGYESMRCESSANIHSSDSSSEKGKSPMSKDSISKTIYELDDEIRGINVKDEDKARFAQTSLFRAQIKELISQRQDLKEELQQTLKRLVLNRVPLPDIDERLREISMQGGGNTTQVLSRENRILERKVRVCKSHLELVSCLEAANKQKTPPPQQQQKKRSSYHKLSAKLKAKLLNKSPPTTPSRKSYKVTSV